MQDSFLTEDQRAAEEAEMDDLLTSFKKKGNVKKNRKPAFSDLKTMYSKDAHHTPAEELLEVGREGFPYQGPPWSPPPVSCMLILGGGTYGFSAYLRAKKNILRATIRVFGLI